jgi:3-oxoacyl-[acyl-carrier protein] reductase
VTGQLTGRRILVTGAATGIGAAAVEVLAAEGAILAATYRETPAPDQLASLATWFSCDFRRAEEADPVVDQAAEVMGGLDVLVHAAGRWHSGIPGQLTEDGLEAMLATNVKATVYANQAAFRHMKERGGQIVNFGSSEGVSGMPFSASYSMSKGAVHSWTRSAAKAWGKHAVTVKAVNASLSSSGPRRQRRWASS